MRPVRRQDGKLHSHSYPLAIGHSCFAFGEHFSVSICIYIPYTILCIDDKSHCRRTSSRRHRSRNIVHTLQPKTCSRPLYVANNNILKSFTSPFAFLSLPTHIPVWISFINMFRMCIHKWKMLHSLVMEPNRTKVFYDCYYSHENGLHKCEANKIWCARARKQRVEYSWERCVMCFECVCVWLCVAESNGA